MHERLPDEPMADVSETERRAPEIAWAGRLDGGNYSPHVWRGKISASLNVIKERFGLPDRQSARNKLNDLKETIQNYYVKTNPEAVVRCVDGRGEKDVPPDPTNLGPQVPGGTAVTSLAYRFSIGLSTEATIELDVENYRNLLAGRPYIPGGHEDDATASDPENTGCGAIDKMLEILKIMREYVVDDAGNSTYRVYEYAKAISSIYMDESSFEQTFNHIQANLQTLNGPHLRDRYFQKEVSSDTHRFRSGILNKVREGGRSGKKTVERLTGAHKEVFLIINQLDDETFNRDSFSSSTEGNAQAFNYDVWVIAQRARDIFPDDFEKQRTMLLTNIMYAVGTVMALTDGSLEVGIRQ